MAQSSKSYQINIITFHIIRLDSNENYISSGILHLYGNIMEQGKSISTGYMQCGELWTALDHHETETCAATIPDIHGPNNVLVISHWFGV